MMEARRRLSTGTYHRPNSPIATPIAQVHTHQRSLAGRTPGMMATMSMAMKATAQPIVIAPVTSLSFASRGGARRRAGFSGVELACGSPVTSLG
jgi:hypothetical protein